MRYPASEKLEIIRLVEESALPVRRTLEKVGIPRATFYRYSQGYWLGMVLPLDGPRRLLPLYHCLEAVHHDEGRERHRHARNGAGCLGARQSQSPPSAKAAVRQRLLPNGWRATTWTMSAGLHTTR
jgi:hypothetical protein